MMAAPRENKKISLIRKELQTYAERGVFRSFSENANGRKHEFRFVWLTETPFLLIYSRDTDTLTLKDLLPAVGKKSAVDKGVRLFLKSRQAGNLPEHRLIDRQKIKLGCINRSSGLSFSLKLLSGCTLQYAVNRAVNLASDIFHGFLKQPENTDYMRDNFGLLGE